MFLINTRLFSKLSCSAILAKYYDGSGLAEQKIFEEKLFQATKKANSEIVLLDGDTIVYKSHDLFFYVVDDVKTNELMLH